MARLSVVESGTSVERASALVHSLLQKREEAAESIELKELTLVTMTSIYTGALFPFLCGGKLLALTAERAVPRV